jgi:WD40 repeat protein
MSRRRPLAWGILLAAALPAHAGEIDFYRDLYPVLKANCISCHNKTTTKAGLNMETPALMRKGGDSGEGVIPGKSADSLIVQAAIHTEDLAMPPKNNKTGAVNLTPPEIALLKTWVDQGAHDSVKIARAVTWQALPPSVEPIYAAALTGDGRYAACGRANEIWLYDLATQQPAGRLTDEHVPDARGAAHRAMVETLAFSPDGERLASGSFREVKIWRRSEASIPLTLPAAALASHPQSIVLSPDRTRLCTLGPDGVASIVAVKDGRSLATGEPLEKVRAIAWSPDGQSLALGRQDGTIRLWSGPEWKEAKTLPPGEAASLAALAWAADGSSLFIAGEDGKVRGLSLADGKVTLTYAIPGTVALACSPDGAHLAAGLKDGAVQVWSVPEGKLEAQMRGDLSAERHHAALARQVDAQTVELAFQTREITRIEAENKALEELLKKAKATSETSAKGLPERHAAAQAAITARAAVERDLQTVTAIIPEPADEAEQVRQINELLAKLPPLVTAEKLTIAAAAGLEDHRKDADTEIERIEAGKARNAAALTVAQAASAAAKEAQKTATTGLATLAQATAKGGVRPLALAFSSDNQCVAALGEDGIARAWALATARPTAEASLGSATTAASLVAAPEGGFLACSAAGATLSLNTQPRWTLERTLGATPDSPFADRVEAVRFSPDGQTLAAGGGEPSRSGDLSLWDVATGKLRARWDERHTDSVCSLDFSPDGKYLVSGGADKLARLTEIATGKQVRAFEGHTHHVLGVSFRADGRTLATAGGDGVVLIWDVATGERQKKIEGWNKEVTSLQYLGATSQIVTSGGDNLVRIVTDEGAELRAIPKLPDFMQAAAGAPAAALIIGGGEDSALRVWDSKTGKELAAFKAN